MFSWCRFYYDSSKELWVDKKDLNKKCRLYRSTKPKIDKEKNKKLRKLSNKSKRINRGNK